ncbi:hypothetical protein ALI144C_16225 [Actinosynnema sp. ALI-1.44]|uniref:hypothetical protein n=1 Tax=Actinosynnema sp. ALI-1.44 TaxID=1933779 RepID=UPI00097C41BF|nr:hypothetical protein [Actinosynnema sp. ALI-1.44]ONI84212.1 hypothetical protein ALI144C_16225 [Actinosynnema sp. ALI-1.44]
MTLARLALEVATAAGIYGLIPAGEFRRSGSVSAYCLGLGLDTLTLTATILTVVVMDDTVFDDLFGETVRINTEGVLVTAADASSVSEGLPFAEETIQRLLTSEPMASPGACILSWAWRYRDTIL